MANINNSAHVWQGDAYSLASLSLHTGTLTDIFYNRY